MAICHCAPHQMPGSGAQTARSVLFGHPLVERARVHLTLSALCFCSWADTSANGFVSALLLSWRSPRIMEEHHHLSLGLGGQDTRSQRRAMALTHLTTGLLLSPPYSQKSWRASSTASSWFNERISDWLMTANTASAMVAQMVIFWFP